MELRRDRVASPFPLTPPRYDQGFLRPLPLPPVGQLSAGGRSTTVDQGIIFLILEFYRIPGILLLAKRPIPSSLSEEEIAAASC